MLMGSKVFFLIYLFKPDIQKAESYHDISIDTYISIENAS
jgi:hypothetical protein